MLFFVNLTFKIVKADNFELDLIVTMGIFISR